MRKILLLFAHPALRKSRINRVLADVARDVPGVTFHDLYENYPHQHIDVRKEQELLGQHDVIVLQHPFYWYSTPPILKQWQDLVLEHGYAYGQDGNALKGKWWVHALTAGGPADAYQTQGYNHFTIRQLLAPLEQTANLCQMVFFPPFVIHGTFRITDEELDRHARHYRHVLERLRDDELTEPDLIRHESLNQAIPLP